MASFADRLGLEVDVQEVLPGRPNVIVRLEPPQARRSLLLEAHTDTVAASPGQQGRAPRIAGGRVHGRGACDVKGGLAAALHALELLAGIGDSLETRVELLAAVDEEAGYAGIAHYLAGDRAHADGAIVIEPTDLEIVVAHKGCVRIVLETRGLAAHTAVPERGRNAIDDMFDVLRTLQDWHRERLNALAHPFCSGTLLTVSEISGGVAINVVPDRCTASIDYRTLPDEDPEAVVREIEALLERLSGGGGPTCTIREIIITDWGLDTPTDAGIVESACTASRATLGHARVAGAPYGSDASKLARRAGIPTIVLGPGSIVQAHGDDEWISIDDVVKASELYARVALDLR